MNKVTFLLLVIFFFCQKEMISQSPVNQIGGRALGVSGSSVTYSDLWSQYHNQAGLAYLKGISVGLSFQNQFLVKELSTKSVAFALPLKSGVFGLNYYYFGYPKYNESKVGLAFARSLGKKIAMGIQLNYNATRIQGEYGSNGVASGEIGILTKPVENLQIAAHLNNVWRTKRSSYGDEYLPSIFKIGASYHFYNKALLCAELEKDLELDYVFKTGLEFELIDKLFVRSGISTNPNLFSFGIGYSFPSFKVDLGFSKHPVLGYSQGISLVYQFKDRI